jgi:hypothetical protein
MTDWIMRWHHDITPVADLPLPQELERPACMAGRRMRGAHRRIRQAAPRPEPKDCCQYHNQDWTLASETAIRLLAAAQAEGLAGEDAAERVAELARFEGLDTKDVNAIECLVSTVDPIMLDDDGDINEGRHRIQAMIDQGVHRTVLLRLVLLDPATGQPA